MKDKIKIHFGKIRRWFASVAGKIIGRFRKAGDSGSVWMFIKRYGYYASLIAVLVILGCASNAYRSKAQPEQEETVTEPFSVSSVIMPEATVIPEQTESAEEIEYEWPVNGGIITPFSDTAPIWSETLMQWKTHPAVDISACAGESVTACADGVVKEAYNDPLWGNVIVIAHGDGMESVYANLSTLNLVECGTEVGKSDVISAVGKSADAESAMPWHLHFAFRNENGVYLDFSGYVTEDETER